MEKFKDFKLNLLKDTLDPKEVHIINSKVIKINEYIIEIGFIDKGHFISFSKNNKVKLTEIFSINDFDIDNLEKISTRRTSFIKREYLDYLFKVYDLNASFSEFEIQRFNKENVLSYRDENNNLFQFIIKREGSILKIRTLHNFNKEGHIIISDSVISLK